MAEHTPGPWLLEPEHYATDAPFGTTVGVELPLIRYAVFAADRVTPLACTVGICQSCDGSEAHDGLLANAQLIAAAPDLLADLELIVKGWEEIAKDLRPLTDWEQERLKFARAAIAQAKGE